MRKIIFSFLIILCLFVLFSNSVWALTPTHSVDTILKGINASGIRTFGNDTVIIQVVLVNPTSHQAHTFQRFSYFGVDTATGFGINIVVPTTAGNGLDTTAFVHPPSGQRIGTMLNVQGTIGQFNGFIQLVPTPADSTAFRVIGTGFGFPTTLVSSVSTFMIFDATLQTGGEFHEGRLVRINNVSIMDPAFTISANAGTNLWISDFSGASTILRFDGTAAGGIGPAFVARYGNRPEIMTGTFDVIGIGGQWDTTDPRGDVGHQILSRGMITDFISSIISVLPGNITLIPNAPAVTFSATGAMPPYTWSLAAGSVGSIHPNTGVYTPGALTGTATIIATDQIGRTGSATVTVSPTAAPLVPDVVD